MPLDRVLSDEELEFLVPYSYNKRSGKLRRHIPTLPRITGAQVEHGIKAKDGETLRLVFEKVNSDWRQGVHLETDRLVVVDGKPYRHGVVVFYNPEHSVLLVSCHTKEGMLWVWNVWDYRPHQVSEPPGSVMSHMNYCGMLVEELPNGYRYRCNEGRDDDDYDDLVFRIERTGP